MTLRLHEDPTSKENKVYIYLLYVCSVNKSIIRNIKKSHEGRSAVAVLRLNKISVSENAVHLISRIYQNTSGIE